MIFVLNNLAEIATKKKKKKWKAKKSLLEI